MCGIAGIISPKKIPNLNERIKKMVNSMHHRGPDARGVQIINNAMALGHCRLSVIDLDPRSNQPMISKNGNILVYNGEIYNYKEIRREITYDFQTESDTEVLLAGIETRGIDWMLKRCNGMFAFAYYDKKIQQIILGRDRLGIKPLNYYIDGNLFVFASEIKAILNSGLVKAEFNATAIDEYLGNRYVREPYTFFKNVYQIKSGHYVVVDKLLHAKEYKYWDLPADFNFQEKYDEDELKSEFKRKVEKAITRRLISDVPMGTYLSGGIDSSLITAVAACNRGDSLETFTIGFSELNEFSYARKVAKKYHTHHHEIIMDTDRYFEMMQTVISYKDAPLGVPNEIPLAEMSKELKKSITVVLSGEGADELMGGYGRIFRSPYDFLHVDRGVATSFYNYFINLYEYVPRALRDCYLKGDHPYREYYDTKIKQQFGDCPNEENVFRFFHRFHVKGLLQRCDTTTMLASVEARVPFLDHTLIEYCYKNIPYNLKLKWNDSFASQRAAGLHAADYSERLDTPKYLLKEIAYDYLPKDVIERKKVGFPVPLNSYVDHLSRYAEQILRSANWLHQDKLTSLITECEKQKRAGQILWMFINVETFRHMYFDKEWRY